MKTTKLLLIAATVGLLLVGCAKGNSGDMTTGYTITVNAGTGGAAWPNVLTAEEGTVITLTAKPDEGYEFDDFDEFTATGITFAYHPTANLATFMMPAADVIISASFSQVQP